MFEISIKYEFNEQEYSIFLQNFLTRQTIFNQDTVVGLLLTKKYTELMKRDSF
mgnify:CR=1 FL=1